MIRCICSITAFSLILTAVLALPGRAAGEPKKDLPKVEAADVIEVIKAELRKLEIGLGKDIGGKIDGVKQSIQSLQADIANLKTQQQELKAQIENQKAMIDWLMEDRKKVTANSSPTEKRISNYGPGAIATTGRVNLVNVFSESVLFTVNGVVHVVPAGRTKMLDNVPTGTVSYDVFSGQHGYLDRQVIDLLAGETFTLTVYPRR